MAQYILVLVMAGSEEEAGRIAEALLAARKAACVNIVPGVRSLFWWQGRRDTAQETLLLVKTVEEELENVVALVKGAHSYQDPEVIALPIVGGSQDYLDWIDETVREAR